MKAIATPVEVPVQVVKGPQIHEVNNICMYCEHTGKIRCT